jgi:hypothetical protein
MANASAFFHVFTTCDCTVAQSFKLHDKNLDHRQCTNLTSEDWFHDAAYLKASHQRNVAQFNNQKSQRTTNGKQYKAGEISPLQILITKKKTDSSRKLHQSNNPAPPKSLRGSKCQHASSRNKISLLAAQDLKSLILEFVTLHWFDTRLHETCR